MHSVSGVSQARGPAGHPAADPGPVSTTPSAAPVANGDDLFRRAWGNPLLTAQRWPHPVDAVLNPGAALVDGVTVLLCRVEDRRGISELTVARSADGVSNWVVDPAPMLSPSEGHPEEAWGVEDPRITRVDELDCWVIAYTAFGPRGPAVALATTRDFTSVRRLGVVRAPEDMNAALLPRRVGGDFIMFHRPVSVIGGRPGVWLSRSTDLRGWAAPEPVFGPRPGWWDSARVGIGPPPIETPEGWLVIYHGVRDTVAGALYRVGLVLLDLDHPTAVRSRAAEWVLGPTEPYELTGNVPGVVFPCGLTHRPDTGELRLYYGAANTCIAMATARLDDVLTQLLADSHTPEPAAKGRAQNGP
jgi:predicted GH43/DUF377 family glycosyl hydrolase